MSRYRRQVRPIWGDDEPTWSEQASKGIGSAIDLYLRNKEAEREWENEVGRAGGTVDPAPSGWDNVKKIGQKIGDRLPGGHERQAARANENLDKRGIGAMIGNNITAHDVPREGDFEAPYPNGVIPIRGPHNRSLDTNATARDGVTRAPKADEIERTIVKGPNGRTGIMPTSFGEFARRQRVTDEGMIERAQARPRTGMTHAERLEIEEIKNENRTNLMRESEQLRMRRALATRKNDRAELLRLDQAERRLDLQAQALGISIDRTLATVGEPDAFERAMAEGDETATARIGVGDRRRQSAASRLETTRQGITGAAGARGAYSSNPQIRRAQELWDSNPQIQASRPRPR